MHRLLSRLRPLLPSIALGLWVLVLYGYSLSLPLFADDLVHFRWLDWHGLPQIWRTAEALGYWRPVPFTFRKLIWLVLGTYDPLWLHALSLVVHGLNTILVHAIANRLVTGTGLRWTPFMTALFFASYPFSYQVVPYVGAVSHPMVTLLVLSALNLYWEARTTSHHKRLLLIGAGLCASLAPLANEAGIAIAPLLLLMEAFGRSRGRLDQRWKPALAMVLAPWPGVVWWTVTPKSVDNLALSNFESLVQSGVYFLQGLMYPISHFAKGLMAATGVNDLTAIAAVSLVGLALLLVESRRSERSHLLALSILWWAASLTPVWLFRGFNYLVDAPRVLYLSSVGSALVWAATVEGVGEALRRRGVGLFAKATLAGAILLFSAAFIGTRMDLYTLGGRLVREAKTLAQGIDPDRPLLIVNFTAWLAPRESSYALGHEGVTLLTSYVGMRDLIYVNSGLDRPADAVVMEDLLKDPGYTFAPYGSAVGRREVSEHLRRGAVALITEFEHESLHVDIAGWILQDTDAADEAPLAVFGEKLALLGASCDYAEDRIQVDLTWHSISNDLEPLTIFSHLYDNRGLLVASWDRPPVGGLLPFPLWRRGDVVEDVRGIPLPHGLRSGQYEVRVGVYDPITDQRAPVSGPLARRADNSVLGCSLDV